MMSELAIFFIFFSFTTCQIVMTVRLNGAVPHMWKQIQNL